MEYRIATFPMTLSDLQGHSSVEIAFSNDIYRTVMQQLTKSNRYKMSRGLSATAELLNCSDWLFCGTNTRR